MIFDMDGVLVKSEHAMRSAGVEVLAKYGVCARESDFLPFTGMGEERFLAGVAEQHGVRYRPEMKQQAYALYLARARDMVYVFPTTQPALRSVRAMGFRVAVASSADRVKVLANLACIGVEESFFDAVVTGSEAARKKPDPELFLLAAKKLGLAPARCLVTEDAVSGIQAAKAAGMASIAVTTSFGAETLRNLAGPDEIVPDIGGVPQAAQRLRHTLFGAAL